jgi:uncharacterized protein YjbI with pentapeptide repeats
MKRLLAVAMSLGLISTSASAQNMTQISHAASGASCASCNLFQANFQNLELKGLRFDRARLRQATLALAILNNSSFVGADMRDVDAYGTLFGSANLSGANLTNASLVGAYFEHANLSGANLDGSNLSGAELRTARGLTQSQLNRSCGDASTVLPQGLRIPACR